MISEKIKIIKPYILENVLSDLALSLIAEALETLLLSQPASIEHIKNCAKVLKNELKTVGISIKHGHSLEISSKILGFKNWDTASAILKNGGRTIGLPGGAA
ncbi:MAG: glyoxalase superfamily protein [Sulfuricurvum sp.]|jgi:hypothetical protein|uniref:glyoxalase superfamily protein n=1 Tax=Sulfuricurvum sp. TaxID=2025608 RepID=UPI0025E7BD06|nr:glyoxalase superfamily protein [Sulfuricurvum sp.]MCK9373626.1 glyoxalase superfamily protein [Sulfuricurvum sp.]